MEKEMTEQDAEALRQLSIMLESLDYFLYKYDRKSYIKGADTAKNRLEAMERLTNTTMNDPREAYAWVTALMASDIILDDTDDMARGSELMHTLGDYTLAFRVSERVQKHPELASKYGTNAEVSDATDKALAKMCGLDGDQSGRKLS
jgi:hypothetical protein